MIGKCRLYNDDNRTRAVGGNLVVVERSSSVKEKV